MLMLGLKSIRKQDKSKQEYEKNPTKLLFICLHKLNQKYSLSSWSFEHEAVIGLCCKTLHLKYEREIFQGTAEAG